eukprot:6867740-Ditylum_brightwellii.AAC.1
MLHIALSLFGVAAARNEDVEQLCIFVAENYFLEKYDCQNLQYLQGSTINHCSAGNPNPESGNRNKRQTRHPNMG